MKKLLYVTFENSENQASGVNKKIAGHLKAFHDQGLITDLVAVYGKDIAVYRGEKREIVKSGTIARITLCQWAANHASEYDAVYIRFQFFSPFVLKMLRAFHKAKAATILEIPTYPYEEELKAQGMKGIPKRIVDTSCGCLCAKYIDTFASPLWGKEILGRPCIEIYNGIDAEEVTPRKILMNETIDLLAVAMMGPWHGYDRMIRGLHEYYIRGGKRNVVLHLVGEGAATAEYAQLTDEFALQEHVVQHGRKSGKELDAMYDMADIGIGSIGTFRKKVFRTNTLKVLEYIAKGLPVICEEGEIGIPEGSKYRMSVPQTEDPVDIDRLIAFYDTVYTADPKTVSQEIREYCLRHCSPAAGLKGVFTFLKERKIL